MKIKIDHELTYLLAKKMSEMINLRNGDMKFKWVAYT